ncbi:MAG: GC-type dockerin domain-anchored protein [Phycisphaerales bacterium]
MKAANGAGGGPLPMSGGTIYFGGFGQTLNTFGGVLVVRDTTPVEGLKTVVFQVQIGEAWTYDFYNRQLPTLSYNGGSQRLDAATAVITDRYDNGTVQMPSGPERLYNNTHLLQWDLRGIQEPIAEFAIEFAGVQHAQVYAMALDQSDVFTPVPQACYANCDGSTAAPALNVADFGCFLQRYASGNPYANCDHSTAPPVLNVADFGCFLQRYAQGCP